MPVYLQGMLEGFYRQVRSYIKSFIDIFIGNDYIQQSFVSTQGHDGAIPLTDLNSTVTLPAISQAATQISPSPITA